MYVMAIEVIRGKRRGWGGGGTVKDQCEEGGRKVKGCRYVILVWIGLELGMLAKVAAATAMLAAAVMDILDQL